MAGFGEARKFGSSTPFAEYQMNQHEVLHRTLSAAAQLLDSAATQIRDVQLAETRPNIRLIGEALAAVFQVQHNVEAVKPELAKSHPVRTEEEIAANRRLGAAMLSADDLAEGGSKENVCLFLEEFASKEPSPVHRKIALHEAARYRTRDNS